MRTRGGLRAEPTPTSNGTNVGTALSRRPWRFTAGASLSIALGGLVLAIACGTSAPPKLDVSAPTTEPGAGPRGDTGAATIARYDISNSGDGALVIHGLAPDCGCALASGLPDVLRSSEHATIALRCRASSEPRPAVRESRLFTNDPTQPDVKLRVPLVAAGGVAEPPALYFGYVPVGGAAIRELITDAVPAALDPAISVEARPPRDGRPLFRIRWAPTVDGPFRSALTLSSGVVPLTGVGFGDVLVFPAEVVLPNAATSGAPPTITLTSVRNEPLAIVGIELPAGLAAEVVPASNGHEFRLPLRLHGPTQAVAGVIRVHTNAPDEPVIAIPVRSADAT